MDPLENAIRRYHELKPDPEAFERYKPLTLKNLRLWLERDVCQAVAPYLSRVKFQKEAAWSLHHLTKGATSAERQAVQKVDDAMVDAAKTLLQAIDKPTIQKLLRTLNPPRNTVVATEVIIMSGENPRTVKTENATVDLLAEETSRIRQIATRFWDDLVFSGDFFVPRGGWHGSLQHNQYGEFVASFHREFLPLGDMISMCMFRRIDLLHRDLISFQAKCIQVLRKAKRTMNNRLQKCQHALDGVNADIASLKSLVTLNPYSIRTACICLTQLYLMFNPKWDASWLGLDERTLAEGPRSLHAHMTNQRNVEFYDLIAVSLKQLCQLYQNEPELRSEFDEAVANGGLVIDEESGVVYWEKNRVECDWSKNRLALRMLIRLAMATRLQRSIEDIDVYDDQPRPESSSAFPQLKNRLANLLPASLKKLIVIGAKKATYRLDLPKGHTHVFPTTSKK